MTQKPTAEDTRREIPSQAGTRARPLQASNTAGYAAPAGITADPVVFAPRDDRLCVLLVRRRDPPHRGRWALPGGFMNPEEEPEETAQRKLTEKTGIGTIYLEQLATYGSPRRDPRGWIPSVAYLALVNATVLREHSQSAADARRPRRQHGWSQTASQASWFRIDELPRMAFDHDQIIRDGIERLRGKLWYSNIAVALLPERFTLAEVRRLYEAISGVRYEVSNFRRALEQSEMIRPTAEVRHGPSGRPARLYEFVQRQAGWNSRRSRMPGALRE